MVGMSQIKKKTIQGIAIGAGIGAVGIGLTIWWATSTIKTYEQGTNKKFNDKYTRMVSVLTRDVIQGEVITDDMVTQVRVHMNTVPSGAESVIYSGKVAKYNIAANVPLTDSMLSDQIIAADIRSQEVNTIVMPSDLLEKDYIDIRIMYPNGTDYIVLAQKQVEKIAGSTIWLDLAEDERLILNSAMVDSYLTTGTKLYATKYADTDSQIKIADELLATDTKETDEDATSTDTGSSTTTTTTTAKTTAATDNASIVRGKLSDAIKSDLDSIKSENTDTAVSTVYNLILKYKSFANAVTRTTENYQPNAQVMAMMQSNGNILAEAKEKLSAEARANIENGIKNYKESAGEDYSNVVSGAQESITTQKSLRNDLLVTTSATVDEVVE